MGFWDSVAGTAGTISGPTGMAIGGGLSLLGGLLGHSKAQNPYGWVLAEKNAYQQQAKDMRDINNQYYTDRTKTYNNDMFDLAMQNANIMNQKAAQNGLSTGDSLANYSQRLKQGYLDAGEQSNKFLNNLYATGLQQSQAYDQLAMEYGKMYGMGQNYANDQNTSFNNQLLGLGGGLLSNAYISGQDNKQNYNYGAGGIKGPTDYSPATSAGYTYKPPSNNPWSGKANLFYNYTPLTGGH